MTWAAAMRNMQRAIFAQLGAEVVAYFPNGSGPSREVTVIVHKDNTSHPDNAAGMVKTERIFVECSRVSGSYGYIDAPKLGGAGTSRIVRTGEEDAPYYYSGEITADDDTTWKLGFYRDVQITAGGNFQDRRG